MTRILQIKKNLRLHFNIAPTVKRVVHGPQTWPWWRLISFSVAWPYKSKSLTYTASLWAYTRWGVRYASLTIDRRTVP